MSANITHFATQTNTKEGPITVLAGEDLTGKEGHLLVLTHDTGVAEVQLPGDVADKADYLLLEGGADGANVTVIALDPSRQVRVVLSGTCNPGDELTNAATDGTTDGQVRTLPADADDYYVSLRAEEAGVDGQHVLARPILDARIVTVS